MKPFKPYPAKIRLYPVKDSKQQSGFFLAKKKDHTIEVKADCPMCEMGMPAPKEMPSIALKLYDENDGQWKTWLVKEPILGKIEEQMGREWRASDYLILKKN